MKTVMVKDKEIERKWHVIDASGKTFGRLISEIATLLIGKHKVCYTPHVDCGDYVVVVNAKDVRFTGKKLDNKVYYKHTGYFGNVKSYKLKDLVENNVEKLYKLAVRGMLPKNKLRDKRLKRLKVYATATHPHQAQVKGSE